MRRFGILLGVLLVVVLTSTVLAADTTVQVSQNAPLGKFFADSKGMTLYAFKKDTANVSNCSGGCLKAWPPLTSAGSLVLPDGVDGTLGTITRSDGTTQVTYNSMPLYNWANDKAPGDTTGEGVGGIWFVVAPGTTFATLGPATSAAALPKSGGSPIILPFLAGLILLAGGARLRHAR